jgi:GAF domain-containing protein
VVCADASVRALEWNTRTMPERGVVYGVARDTTERRRAEAQRRERQREQAALRRVATLVARETPPDEVLAAVAREVGEVLGVDATQLGRYDPDGTVVSVAQWGSSSGIELGARFHLDGDSVSARVLRTGRAARMDGYEGVPGTIATLLGELGIRFAVGVPISVGGRTWGVMTVTSKGAAPFPAETESRLQDFTDLLATAITNAAAHDKARALAEEQAALRRVATLVARQAPQTQVFGAIAEEIGRLLTVDTVEVVRFEDDRVAVVVAVWGPLAASLPTGSRTALGGHNIASLIFRTGRAARIDDYSVANGPIAERMAAGGVLSALGTPIVVEGRVWGAVVAAATHDVTVPANTDARIAQLAELTATGIANAEARTEVTRLAEEQAALRRVARLVAQGAAPAAVFDAVTAEAGAVMDAASVTLARYDDGDVLVVLAHHGGSPHLHVGQRVKMEPTNLTWDVRRTGRAARRDHAGDGRARSPRSSGGSPSGRP